MKAEELLKYIGDVDDRYVDELFADHDVVMISKSRTAFRRRIYAIAASLAVIILGTFIMVKAGVGMHTGASEIRETDVQIPLVRSTVIMIDINPSLRLEIDDRDKVSALYALNDDAEVLESELQVCGKNYKEAVTDVLKVMQEKKYLTDLKNSVLVTVLDPSETVAESYRKETVDAINAFDDGLSFPLSVLSQYMTDESAYVEKAQDANVSTGRMAFVCKICEECGGTVDMLISYNIQVLNQVLDYVGIPVGVERTGSVAGVIDDVTRGVLGIATMTTNEIIGFSYSLYDFLEGLCNYYDEADVASQNGYELGIKQDNADSGTALWSIFARDTGSEDGERTTYSQDYGWTDTTGYGSGIQSLFGWLYGDSGKTGGDAGSENVSDVQPEVTIRFKAN